MATVKPSRKSKLGAAKLKAKKAFKTARGTTKGVGSSTQARKSKSKGKAIVSALKRKAISRKKK